MSKRAYNNNNNNNLLSFPIGSCSVFRRFLTFRLLLVYNTNNTTMRCPSALPNTLYEHVPGHKIACTLYDTLCAGPIRGPDVCSARNLKASCTKCIRFPDRRSSKEIGNALFLRFAQKYNQNEDDLICRHGFDYEILKICFHDKLKKKKAVQTFFSVKFGSL